MKVQKIEVQAADTILPVTSPKTEESVMTFNEPRNNIAGSFTPVNVRDSPISSLRTSKSISFRQDVLRTCNKQVKNEDGAETRYGDLVVIDLGSSFEPILHD